ncbi:cold-shock protein [Paenibacillus gansuensis]|uniref:Cold-shock protein n=1 Tax=Paenibacillus gansuensis TaxID=306542 RepID=A0ABW5P6Q4_9BACL
MYNKRIPLEDLVHENTKIWSCVTEGCSGWMRDNFAFDTVPTCHQCHASMVSSEKMLPALTNSNKDVKALKRGIQIV